ncbi:MAG TPA: hypothetical protein VMU05_08110, partial [Dongiaceae bacterium]|nr:hypothetical protein [Dongiaceae bacterium]
RNIPALLRRRGANLLHCRSPFYLCLEHVDNLGAYSIPSGDRPSHLICFQHLSEIPTVEIAVVHVSKRAAVLLRLWVIRAPVDPIKSKLSDLVTNPYGKVLLIKEKLDCHHDLFAAVRR